MGAQPSGPHLNLLTSQQFYLQIPSNWELELQHMTLAGVQTFSPLQCVCVTDEWYMGLGCEELHKPGSYVLALYFNARFCPNCWAICLSRRFWKYHRNTAILQLSLGKFSSKFSSSWRRLCRLSGCPGRICFRSFVFLMVGLWGRGLSQDPLARGGNYHSRLQSLTSQFFYFPISRIGVGSKII